MTFVLNDVRNKYEELELSVKGGLITDMSKLEKDLTYVINHPKVKPILKGKINPRTGELIGHSRGEKGEILHAAITWFPNNIIRGPALTERANDPER